MSNDTAANNRFKPTIAIRNNLDQGVELRSKWRFIPAAFLSFMVHGGLVALMVVLTPAKEAASGYEKKVEDKEEEKPLVDAPPQNENSFAVPDVDPDRRDPDVAINYNVDRIEKFSIPGIVTDGPIGVVGGSESAPPSSIPAPAGFGAIGVGGAISIDGVAGNSNAMGDPGGYGNGSPFIPGSYKEGRSGATKEKLLREGGGTEITEACVNKSLGWLARQQNADGSWSHNGNFPDNYNAAYNVAGTAFGLLPMLAAGKTHKLHKDNPYDKPIEKGLLYLLRVQNRQTGRLGSSMYEHGLATITLCEAYGLSQDPMLRKPAQMAIDFIVDSQHDEGGWRYAPKQAGDTSVVGWMVMGLKSGQMAGLNVSPITLRKVINYLEHVCDKRQDAEGYGYTGPGASRTMTAVGLLCRQYMQGWGRQNNRLQGSVHSHLMKYQPDVSNDVYYYYYATQVMHHFGGEEWKIWNAKMREKLVKSQDPDGSWKPKAGGHCAGRLMMTSLNCLTLEVYYRYLPLYYREQGAAMDANADVVKKGT